MAKTVAKPPARKKAAVPEGYVQRDTKPGQLALEPGLELLGRLGAVSPGKGDMPAYRTITTEDGRFFLPSHASLQCLMEEPTGTEVWLKFDGGEGKKGDPYLWTVAVKENGHDGDVPF